jgi:hypothetical protein
VSNVLIGIIGVILFIGLALAGALILGDDFRSSTNDTKAATVTQGLAQLAQAVSMSNLKTGRLVVSQGVSPGNALIPRFLKSVPYNPISRENLAVLVEAGGGVNGGPATTAAMLLGETSNKEARAVCESIQRQSGQIGPTDTFNTDNPGSLQSSQLPTVTGCIWNSVNYYAFSRI